jgi:large subunit ribosomal protein L30
MAKNTKSSIVKIKQVRSGSGKSKSQKATLVGLGLNKINKESELIDTVAVRGMISKVKHLVTVVE